MELEIVHKSIRDSRIQSLESQISQAEVKTINTSKVANPPQLHTHHTMQLTGAEDYIQ